MDNQDRFNKMINKMASEAQERPIKDKTKTVTSTMPESLIEQITEYAIATNISKSRAIAELVKYGFDYLMDKTE